MSDQTTINCEEALRLLAGYLDGELRGTEQAGVELHLKTCRSCYSRAEFERRLLAEISHLGREAVRPALAERIRQLITQFASSPAGESADP